MIHLCKLCYKELKKPIKFGQKYCSKECRKKVQKKQAKEWYRKHHHINKDWDKEKPCVLCDKIFRPKTSNNRFCSKECFNKVNNVEYVKNNLSELDRRGILNSEKLGFLKMRMMIFDRDGFRCKYCGRSPMKDPDVILHVDHRIPKKEKGKNIMENLITSCRECNLGKSDFMLDLWKDKNNFDKEAIRSKIL